MATGKHALLSASSADRWLHCPPSARLTESLPDTSSEFAEEGSLAHAIAELRLSEAYTKPLGPKQFGAEMDRLKANPLYRPEMDRCIDEYLDFIDGVVLSYDARPYVAVEVRVDFSNYVPEGFGTSDCIVIGGDTMHVVDLKYGRGVEVSPERNPQMMLYALGALNKYGFVYPIEHVVLSVCQPRLNNIERWRVAVRELTAWGESVAKPGAKVAFEGGGEAAPGDWCKFCKIKARCEARTNPKPLEDLDTCRPQLIDNLEIARRIQAIQPYVQVLEDLEKLALAECLAGRAVPGFKAVEGTSRRAWIDQPKAFQAAIDAGYDEALLYKREPLTLTAVEELMGKKVFKATLAMHVAKPQGKPTLVPESDKRPPFNGQSSIEDDFKEVI